MFHCQSSLPSLISCWGLIWGYTQYTENFFLDFSQCDKIPWWVVCGIILHLVIYVIWGLYQATILIPSLTNRHSGCFNTQISKIHSEDLHGIVRGWRCEFHVYAMAVKLSTLGSLGEFFRHHPQCHLSPQRNRPLLRGQWWASKP